MRFAEFVPEVSADTLRESSGFIPPGFDLDRFVAEQFADEANLFSVWHDPLVRAYRAAGLLIDDADASAFVYSDEFKQWYAGNRDVAERHFRQEILTAVATIRDTLFDPSGKIHLWRVMKLAYDPVVAIRSGKRDLGRHWAYQPDDIDFEYGSRGYGETMPATQEPQYYMFEALAPLASVDWGITLYHYVALADFEREIVLRDGAPIELLAIHRFKGHTPVRMKIAPSLKVTCRA